MTTPTGTHKAAHGLRTVAPIAIETAVKMRRAAIRPSDIDDQLCRYLGDGDTDALHLGVCVDDTVVGSISCVPDPLVLDGALPMAPAGILRSARASSQRSRPVVLRHVPYRTQCTQHASYVGNEPRGPDPVLYDFRAAAHGQCREFPGDGATPCVPVPLNQVAGAASEGVLG